MFIRNIPITELAIDDFFAWFIFNSWTHGAFSLSTPGIPFTGGGSSEGSSSLGTLNAADGGLLLGALARDAVGWLSMAVLSIWSKSGLLGSEELLSCYEK